MNCAPDLKSTDERTSGSGQRAADGGDHGGSGIGSVGGDRGESPAAAPIGGNWQDLDGEGYSEEASVGLQSHVGRGLPSGIKPVGVRSARGDRKQVVVVVAARCSACHDGRLGHFLRNAATADGSHGCSMDAHG